MHTRWLVGLPILLGMSLCLLWMGLGQTPSVTQASGPIHPLGVGNTSASGEGLGLKKTVGVNPAVCAATDTISATVGTRVIYCYTITNNTPFTLTDHTVEDSGLGTLVRHLTYPLVPGASAYFTQSAIISTTTVNTATWTAVSPIPSYTTLTGACSPFPDISQTGTALNLADDGAINLNLPFRFQFYDEFTAQLRVGNNGGAMFGDASAQLPALNTAFTTTSIARLMAPFWDDLVSNTGNVYAGMYTTTLTMPGARATNEQPLGLSYFVVEWKDVSHFPQSPSEATFALMLLKPGQGNDGYLIFCYEDTVFGIGLLDNGGSATIGLNKNGSEATQFSYNTAHPELNGGFAVAFLPDGEGQAAVATASARVYVPPLILDKTVGTVPSECASTEVVTITETTEVYYCYKVRNTSPHTLTLHTLEDSALGTLLDQFSYALLPQATVFLTQSATISTTTINTATWTAKFPPTDRQYTATDTATVIRKVIYKVYLPNIYR